MKDPIISFRLVCSAPGVAVESTAGDMSWFPNVGQQTFSKHLSSLFNAVFCHVETYSLFQLHR